MTDPVPLGEAIRALLEADDAVSVHGLTEETRSAFLDAWGAALDAACGSDDEQPAGLSPDVAEAAWEEWQRVADDALKPVFTAEPVFDGASLKWRPLADPYADPLPSAGEILASMERYRAEHGPFLQEMRAGTAVCGYLSATLPRGEPTAYAMMTGKPLLIDETIPFGVLRLVYGDGTTKDLQLLRIEFDPDALPTVDWPAVAETYSFRHRYTFGPGSINRGYRGGVARDMDEGNPDPRRIRRWHIANPYVDERCTACDQMLARGELINIEFEAGVMHAECPDATRAP